MVHLSLYRLNGLLVSKVMKPESTYRIQKGPRPLFTQDRNSTNSRGPVYMGIGNLWVIGNLTFAGSTSEL